MLVVPAVADNPGILRNVGIYAVVNIYLQCDILSHVGITITAKSEEYQCHPQLIERLNIGHPWGFYLVSGVCRRGTKMRLIHKGSAYVYSKFVTYLSIHHHGGCR